MLDLNNFLKKDVSNFGNPWKAFVNNIKLNLFSSSNKKASGFCRRYSLFKFSATIKKCYVIRKRKLGLRYFCSIRNFCIYQKMIIFISFCRSCSEPYCLLPDEHPHQPALHLSHEGEFSNSSWKGILLLYPIVNFNWWKKDNFNLIPDLNKTVHWIFNI